MIARKMIALAALTAAAGAPGWAAKMLVNVTPRGAGGEGFTVTARRRDSAVEFCVVRDLAKVTWQGRSGMLEVPGDKNTTLRRKIDPERKENTETYRFEVPSAQLSAALLTVSEVQTDRAGNKLIGGGTIYCFRLGGFVSEVGGGGAGSSAGTSR